jgi:hypothetical protein
MIYLRKLIEITSQLFQALAIFGKFIFKKKTADANPTHLVPLESP